MAGRFQTRIPSVVRYENLKKTSDVRWRLVALHLSHEPLETYPLEEKGDISLTLQIRFR